MLTREEDINKFWGEVGRHMDYRFSLSRKPTQSLLKNLHMGRVVIEILK